MVCASTHIKSIKAALTFIVFKVSGATFILRFAKDFSVGVYRMSVFVSAPVFVVLKAVGFKNWGNFIKISLCMTSYLPEPCCFLGLFFFSLPQCSTPSPVPMTKTLISIFFFLYSPFLLLDYVLYCWTDLYPMHLPR